MLLLFLVLALIGAVLAIIVAAIAVKAKERDRRRYLNSYLTAQGWHPLGHTLPPIVSASVRSSRTQVAAAKSVGGLDVWVVWHEWVQNIHESDGDTRRRVREQTRYLLWLGPNHPDMEVKRRTSIGSTVMPARGIGTGDAEFDRAFVVHSLQGSYARQLMGPQVRRLALVSSAPPWRIEGGMLVIEIPQKMQVETLEPTVSWLVNLAAALAS